MSENILQNYKRIPKHYIKLPSNGRFYPDGSLKLVNGDELPVRAMTARDELLLKNPEALLNGDSIMKIIQSCIPEITIDPKELITPDVEVIMLAIFSASFQDGLEFNAKCPECNHENEFTASIESVLASVSPLDPPYHITIPLENDQNIKIYVQPYTYEISTKRSIAELEHTKMLQILTKEDMSEEEKLSKFGESFNKMAQFNFDAIADCVSKIEVPDGESTDREAIKEYINEAESSTVEKISELIKRINSSGLDTTFHAACTKCKHEWDTNIEFDPARFFVQSFRR